MVVVYGGRRFANLWYRSDMTISKTAIATWFVADKPGEETNFPQVGGTSSSAEFQKIYWRCVADFFASSLRHNPGAAHLLFTNTDIPIVDDVNLSELFRNWGVQVIILPITFRLPRSAAKSWGNQLYILDIIKFAAKNMETDNMVVLDCDCVWTSTAERISEAISQFGCLTYTLNDRHYPWNAPINGVSRQEMAAALHKWTADCVIDVREEMRNVSSVHYHGGEIFAATREVCCRMAILINSLWDWLVKAGIQGHGIKEEAHFLSILYAAASYSNYTANPFIKRMWTTFHLNNIERSDCDLAIWHLPAEKKTGFRRLFREITGSRREAWATAPNPEYNNMQARFLGVPRRDAKKLLLDISLKLAERGGGIFRMEP
jgi:hypothetical protein